MKNLALLLIILLIFLHPAISQSKNITATFGGALSPYVMKSGPSGLLVDLLNDCLQLSGYKIKAKLHPYARRIIEYQNNQVDVVSDVNQRTIDQHQLKGYYTGNIYAYENFLFSLKQNNFKIKNIAQLADHSLISWQGAINHIGGEYAVMAKANKSYSETHNQKTQLRMLFSKRVDFIQMDGNIYDYYNQELQAEKAIDVNLGVTKLPLFGKSPNGFLFKSKAARDACVSNLESIKKDKKYQSVLYFEA
jgi:polar amino acid transport system substrate-binding protein